MSSTFELDKDCELTDFGALFLYNNLYSSNQSNSENKVLMHQSARINRMCNKILSYALQDPAYH